MAEELPQNSSKHQETSEGPDVNAGARTVNSGEDTAVAQGSQSNQVHASQKNKNMIWVSFLCMELETSDLVTRLMRFIQK